MAPIDCHVPLHLPSVGISKAITWGKISVVDLAHEFRPHIGFLHIMSCEHVKDKDLVMLDVSGLREEYNSLKTTIIAHQSPTTFSELYALISDHDYMLGKTRVPAPSITSSFAANYAVSSPSIPEARQAQLSEGAQLSALGFQVSPIVPFGPQAFYGARPSNNNRSNNNNNRDNHNNSRGNNNNQGRGNGR
ncbi:hypothetical protein Tco_0538216 [Tanacetum coccineum]